MTTLSVERQYAISAIEEINYNELPSGQAVNVIKLPVNAVVVGGGAFVDTATNAANTSVLDVGDADSADLYVTDLDTQTANESEQFDVTEIGKKYPSGGYIRATRTEVGAPATAGKVRIWAKYVILNRVNEVQT
jgi:hypothetical protein